MGALAWGLDMANFENVPVALNGFEMAEVSMLWSVFMREVWLRIQVSFISPASLTCLPKSCSPPAYSTCHKPVCAARPLSFESVEHL